MMISELETCFKQGNHLKFAICLDLLSFDLLKLTFVNHFPVNVEPFIMDQIIKIILFINKLLKIITKD